MWDFIIRFILRNRVVILLVILGITGFMGYQATKVELSYEMVRMLPESDSISINYDKFKAKFGQDGSVLFLGIQDSNLYQLDKFNAIYDLTAELQKMDGVEQVLSVTSLYSLRNNDSLKKFSVEPLINKRPASQQEVDTIKMQLFELPFYNGLLYNKDKNACIVAITLDKKKLNDKSRIDLVNDICAIVNGYKDKQQLEIHMSGLPYIRTVLTQKVESELKIFIILSLIIAISILFLFFRSFYTVISSMLIVAISVVWALGTIVLFDYKITILIGVIPSLLIIIAIENCIFLINKFQLEYKKHQNKIKSLTKVVKRIGFATFITNATTATGFATFMLTSNTMLKEFGVISSLNIMIEYMLCLTLVPILFSFLPPPKPKHLKHLESKFNNTLLNKIIYIVTTKRNYIYASAVVIIIVCIYGATQIKISGRMVDDIPKDDQLYIDMKFLEHNFGGVMPFEIAIDTKQPDGIFANEANTLYKIKKVQKIFKNDSLYAHYFSRPLSLVEGLSFAYQAYRGGDSKYYNLPPPMELQKLKAYLPDSSKNFNAFHSFLDSNRQTTRISIQMADVGTDTMNLIHAHFKPLIDSVFNPTEYNVTLTGSSLVFTKGTEFLIQNLWESIIFGILFISILVALIFASMRMIIIAMIVNLIPLLITAGIMGFFNIPVKPSTIIVFSIALGIAIDNAILFLSRYRHELKDKKHSINDSVLNALREVSSSAIYASIVLILGFGIFMVSGFGGTKALGILISITLLFALFFNILVLPALILTLDKYITTRAFKEPVLDIYDDPEDDSDEIIESAETK